MNETLQQFCQRILPVVQAGAEGKEIESYIGGGHWTEKSCRTFNYDVEYRVAKPKATPLPITPEMWAMIDPKYKWACFQHGCIIFSASKPGWDDETRRFTSKCAGDLCESPLAIDTTGIAPELSLTERPKSADEALKQAMANESRAIKKVIIDGGCDVHGADVHVHEESLLERALKLAEAAEDLSRKVKKEESVNSSFVVRMHPPFMCECARNQSIVKAQDRLFKYLSDKYPIFYPDKM